MTRARHIIRAAAALLTVFALMPPAFASKKDDTLRFASGQVLQNLDPYFNNLVVGAIVAANVWDTLITRNSETGAFMPDLATAWRWVDDRTLEFDLRQGVKFHNGTEFDADDVVYTLTFVSRPGNKVIRATEWIDHVEKLGKYKVRIVTKKVEPAALAILAAFYSVIHPHAYYAKVGPKGMNEKPVGTGPYRVTEHAIGKYIRLERNPDYFNGGPKTQPKIGKVEIRFLPDPQTQVAESVASGVDLIMGIARDQAEQLRAVPGVQIVSGESIAFAYLQMSTIPGAPAPQLFDVRVRQAIMHAVDREAMVKFLVGTDARVLHSECHPGQFGCTDAGVPRYDYDPLKARRLMAEAGYARGFDIDLYAYRDRNQVEALAGYLAAVGIRVHIRFMQTAAVISAQRAGRVSLVFHVSNVGGTRDVSTSLMINHDFLPLDGNRDPEIRDMILRGSSMEDDERKAAYASALKLIAQRAYVFPLYSVPNYYVGASDLVFKHYADNTPKFYEMSWK